MKKSNRNAVVLWLCLAVLFSSVHAQDKEKKELIDLPNARYWEMEGRVQFQHEYNSKIEESDDETNQGFRIRRARLKFEAKINNHVKTELKIDVRDDDPELMDAIGELEFIGDTYIRFGQFKVPVWREEMRSANKLFLIERSEASEFLTDYNLSSRHIGLEFGAEFGNMLEFIINYSNGAGTNEREDAGSDKDNDVNNGKMVSGRLNLQLRKKIEIGLSAARNNAGSKINNIDNTGPLSVIAPDFQLGMDIGENMEIEAEGNYAFGTLDKNYLRSDKSVDFRLFNISGCWEYKFNNDIDPLAGLDKIGIAIGVDRIDPNTNMEKDKETGIRFGPVIYFDKETRLQINGEITNYTEDDKESDFKIRSQITFNF